MKNSVPQSTIPMLHDQVIAYEEGKKKILDDIRNNKEVFKTQIVDLNTLFQTPFGRAVWNDSVELVELFLEDGWDVDLNQRVHDDPAHPNASTVFDCAIDRDTPESQKISRLLASRLMPGLGTETPHNLYQEAVKKGEQSKVLFLMKIPEYRDALNLSVALSDFVAGKLDFLDNYKSLFTEFVKKKLEKGEDSILMIRAIDRTLSLVLKCAAKRRYQKLVVTIIDHFQISSFDPQRISDSQSIDEALWYASLYGYDEIVSDILDRVSASNFGLNIDDAFSAAIAQGHRGVVAAILESQHSFRLNAGLLAEANARGFKPEVDAFFARNVEPSARSFLNQLKGNATLKRTEAVQDALKSPHAERLTRKDLCAVLFVASGECAIESVIAILNSDKANLLEDKDFESILSYRSSVNHLPNVKLILNSQRGREVSGVWLEAFLGEEGILRFGILYRPLVEFIRESIQNGEIQRGDQRQEVTDGVPRGELEAPHAARPLAMAARGNAL